MKVNLLPIINGAYLVLLKFEEKLLESRTCMERAADIFALHYGKWHKTYQEIIQKLDKTKFLAQSNE